MDERPHEGPEEEKDPGAEEKAQEPGAEEKPTEEAPGAEEKPTEQAPVAEEKPTEEAPGPEAEPTEEKPTEEEPTVAGPIVVEPSGGAPRDDEPGAGEPSSEEVPSRAEGPAADEPPAPMSRPGPASGSGPEDPRGTEGPPPPPPAAEAPTQPLGPEPRRLLRSRSNRVVGGVAGGLGNYFNVDPILFRIGAIALALVGGAGVLLYLAALVLIPSEPADATAQPPPEGRNRGLTIAVVVLLLVVAWPFLLGGGVIAAGILFPLAFLVATGVLVWWIVSGEGPSGDAGDIARRAALGIGVLILCGLIAIGSAWAAAAGGGVVVGVLVIASGLAILAGAFLKPVRWLILPAVTVALAAGAVSAAGIDLDGGVGDKTYRPASAIDLQDKYQLGIGDLEVDLRNTDLPAGDRPVAIDLGVGEARLIVPEDVCVATDANVGVGQVDVFDRGSGGVDVDFVEEPDARPDTTRLVVNADIGLGQLSVVHDPADIGGPFDRRFRDEIDDSVTGEDNAACLDTGSSARG
jgi:phage shock protein PspC (stress-responsive transcriptional regulator)